MPELLRKRSERASAKSKRIALKPSPSRGEEARLRAIGSRAEERPKQERRAGLLGETRRVEPSNVGGDGVEKRIAASSVDEQPQESVQIAPRLLRWYDQHGRKTLPWQHPRSAYRVWLSEVMLQQTSVATVIPYFVRFVEKFQSIKALAEAPLDDVLALWSGLGYYSRARNLHRTAQICVEQHGGDLPRDLTALTALPGIGRSTAGAILAQAHGLRFAILEANVKRVLALWSGLGYYSRARNLHRTAQICVEQHGGDLPRDFTALTALPGIGPSTAGAILAQAHGMRFAILDANVKRVLARWRGVRGWPGKTEVTRQLWTISQLQTPQARVTDYTQAIMDLGATVCVHPRPRCGECPLAGDCVAYAQNLTTLLPERKPARALPTRSTIMLVLRDAQNRILLERRPPTGIWAGLWSLPESEDDDAARRRVARFSGRLSGKIAFTPLPEFVHGFSHYRLQVKPLALQLSAKARVGDDVDKRWLHPAEAAELGLPAPVRKLIASLGR